MENLNYEKFKKALQAGEMATTITPKIEEFERRIFNGNYNDYLVRDETLYNKYKNKVPTLEEYKAKKDFLGEGDTFAERVANAVGDKFKTENEKLQTRQQDQSFASSALQAGGNIAKSLVAGAQQIVKEGVGGVAGLTSRSQGYTALGAGIKKAEEKLEGIVQSLPPEALQAIQKGGEMLEQFKKNNPTMVANIDAVASIGELVGSTKVISTISKEALKKTAGVADKLTIGASNLTKVAPSIEPVKFVQRKLREGIEGAKATGQRVLENTKIRAEQRKNIIQEVQKIAEETGQQKKEVIRSANFGVDPIDYKKLQDPTKKPFLNKIATYLPEAVGGDDKNLSRAIGDEFLAKITSAREIQKKVGKQIGYIIKKAEQDGIVIKNGNIEAKLAQGINGIKTTKEAEKLVIDFANSPLRLKNFSQERRLVQDFLSDLSEIKTLKEAQNFRDALRNRLQSIDKKNISKDAIKSLEEMDKLVVSQLDDAVKGYKGLRKRYAPILNKIDGIERVVFGKNQGRDLQDIDLRRDASATALRRISSNATSGSKIRQALREIDKVLKNEKRDPGLDIEEMQEILDILAKYFDLSKANSLEGIVRRTVSKPSLPQDLSPSGIIGKAIEAGIEAGTITPELTREEIIRIIKQTK